MLQDFVHTISLIVIKMEMTVERKVMKVICKITSKLDSFQFFFSLINHLDQKKVASDGNS